MTTPDSDLLQRWRERGDAEAFHDLTVRYGGMVFATSMRIVGNTADAEDVSQKCFEKLLQTSKNPVQHLGPWLHRVATNCALQHIRGEKRRRVREDKYAAESTAEVETQWDDLYDLVDQAIDALPDKMRAPIVMHFLENQSHAAIAEQLGTSRSTISYRITSGLGRIQTALKKKGVSVPVALLGTLIAENASASVPASLMQSLGKLAVARGTATTTTAGLVTAGNLFGGKWALVALGVVVLSSAGLWVTQSNSDVSTEQEGASVARGQSGNVEASNDPPVTSETGAGVGQIRATVTGTVVDVETNAPLQNLGLSFDRRNSDQRLRAVTDDNGRFSVGGLDEGDYFARIDDPYYFEDETVHFAVKPDQKMIELAIDAVRGGSISGRAFEKLTNRPIANLEILTDEADGNPNMMSSDDTVSTDAAGAFRIGGLREGKYEITFNSNYSKLNRAGEVAYEIQLSGQHKIRTVSVRSGETVDGIDFALYLGAEISGIVLDSNGNPVDGVRVYAADGVRSQRGWSQSDGTFVVGGMSPTRTLQLHAAGNGMASPVLGPYVLGEDGLADVEFTVKPAAFIDGILTDSRGRPMKEALIEARLATHRRSGFGAQHTQTGEDGAFRLENLSPGAYVLTASSKEETDSPLHTMAQELTTIEVADGQTLRNIRLTFGEAAAVGEPAGRRTIAGRVTDIRGMPIENAWVYSPTSEFEGRAVTDANGRFQLEGLPEGAFRLAIQHNAYSRGWLEQVAAGTTNANIVLEDRVHITGQVVAADTGEPIPAFDIFHRRTNWINLSTNSNKYMNVVDEEGRFEFDDVEIGPLAVVVRAEGYPDQKIFDEVVSGRKHPPIRIELSRGGRIGGRVINSGGSPVAGALLFLDKVPKNSYADYEDRIVARSDDQGLFQIEGVPLDTERVAAMHPEYAVGDVDYETGVTDVEIVLERGGALEGTVTIAGHPASDVRVAVSNVDFSLESHQDVRTRTGAGGRFQIVNLLPGRYHVIASLPSESQEHERGRNVTSSVSIGSGETTTLEFDVPLANAGIQGRVLSDRALPPNGAVVATFHGLGGDEMFWSEVNAGGQYEFEAVPAGVIALKFIQPSSRGSGNRTSVVSVTTRANEILNQDIKVMPGVLVTGTLEGRGQGEIANILVLPGVRDLEWLELYEIIPLVQEAVATAMLRDDKIFYLEGLTPGAYTLFTYVMSTDVSPPKIVSQTINIIDVGDVPEVTVRIQL